MTRYLLKLWHRFTLGRTARSIPYCVTAPAGSTRRIAAELMMTATRHLPAHVGLALVRRKSTDLPPGVVRIVLETAE